MNCRDANEDSQPNVPPSSPRHLAFEAGIVDITGMVDSHHGETPTTITVAPPSRALANYALDDIPRFMVEARRLIALGRNDEARYELSQVVQLAEEARRWLV